MRAPTPSQVPATRHAMSRVGSRLALLAVLVTVGLATAAAPSLAHAHVEGSTPAAGEQLDRSPEQVRVWFDEPVELVGTGLQVAGPDGIRVDHGDARHGDAPTELVVSVPDDLPPGTYTAAWRVQAGDSHVQEDGWSFEITGPSGAPDPGQEAADGGAAADPSGTDGQQEAEDPGPADDPEAEPAALVSPDTRVPGRQLGLAALAGLIAAGGAVLALRRSPQPTGPGSR
jgi:copper resistance protein C